MMLSTLERPTKIDTDHYRLSPQLAWSFVVDAVLLGLGPDSRHCQKAIGPIVVNFAGRYGGGLSGCVLQGPGQPPVIFIPNPCGLTEIIALAKALGEAFAGHCGASAHAADDTMTTVFRAGLRKMDTVLSHAVLSHMQDKAVPTVHDVTVTWAMLSGVLRPTDFAQSVDVLTLTADGRVIEGTDGADLSALKGLGLRAFAGLARGDLNDLPDAFVDCQAGTPDVRDPHRFDLPAALGAAILKLAQSPYHRQFSLSYYLPIEIIPPLRHGQVRIYLDASGAVMAFVSWARVSDAILHDLHETGRALRANEWQSGPHLFFNDWITVGGRVRPVLTDLKRFFPDTRASSLRRKRNRDVRKVNTWSQVAAPHDPVQYGDQT